MFVEGGDMMKKVFIGVGHGEKYVNLVEVLIYQGFLEAHSAQTFMSYVKNDTLTEKTCLPQA